MTEHQKIIDFDKWCTTCKYKDILAEEDPCNECLTCPARFENSAPLNYQKREDAE